jgi:hypothetical protein
MNRRCILAVAALCLLPLAAQAQDTYTIKVKKGAKGSITHEQRIDTESSSMTFTDNAGTLITEQSNKSVQTQVFQQTILEKPEGKKPPTLKRTYEKAVVVADNETQVLPYQGKSVLIENKDGKFIFRYEGGDEITGDDAKWLRKEFKDREPGKDDEPDIEKMLFPNQAVKVGETWDIPMAEFVKKCEQENLVVFADKCKGTGKLVKAYKKNGSQFGDFVVKLEMPVKAAKSPDGEIVMQTGTMAMELKLSVCMDGSVEDSRGQFSLQFNGEALLPSADNPLGRGTFSAGFLRDGTTTEVAKK